MNKNEFLYLVVIAILLVSCGTTARQTKTVAPATSGAKEIPISEDEKNKFEYTFIEGLKQKMIGNQQAAISLFSKCLEINPNSSSAMFEMAKIHSSNGDQTSASLLLEKAIHISPENNWYKLMLTQIYQQGKQYEKAAELYQELLKSEPENLEYLYMNAALLATAGKNEQAIDALNQLEKKVGINDQISVQKQQIYQSAGKKKEAQAELQKLIDSNPADPHFYGLMADYFLSEKDEVNALIYYNKILELDPNNGFVNFSLTSFYHQKGEKDKAWEYMKKGFKSKNVDLETKIQYYLLATADSGKQLFSEDQITELMNILLETNGDDYRVYTVYSEYLINRKRLAEARDQLRKVLENNKDNYLIWERMLLVSNDLLDFKSVYTDSEKAIELFPNQAVLYGLRAVACLQLEKYQEAITILDEGDAYVQENPGLKIQFDLYRAEAHYKLNDFEKAFKAFDDVIQIDPQNWLAMNNYAYYLSLRNENLEKAEQLSGKAVRANPDNPTYLDTYAWVLFMRKDYTLAKFYMESAIKNGGDKNGVIVEHYGDILYMLGNIDAALEQWTKAKLLGDTGEFINEKIKQKKYIDKK